MRIISRITAFFTALCLSSCLPFNCISSDAADDSKNGFGAMPFDISAKIDFDLKSFDIPLYSIYDVSEDYDFSDMDSLYTHYDMSVFDEIYKNAENQAAKKADFDDVSESIDKIYDELVKLASLYGIVNVLFYSDTSNSEYNDEMQYTYETYNTVKLSMYQFIKKLAESDFYYDSLVDALGKETVDEYILEGNYVSEEENAYMEKIKELQTEYYSLSNSYASEREFAELYLETVKLNNEYAKFCGYDNYIEYAYESYSRDYTIDEAKSFCKSVNKNISPVFIVMRSDNLRDENYFNYLACRFTADEILDVLDKYTSEMSSEINDSYKYMKKTHAYSIEKNTADKSRYSGAFTIFLPGYDVPYIFSTIENNANDLTKVVHEFGHYNEYYRAGQNGSSIDVSEISSQAFELLYSRYYPRIFGRQYEYISVRNMLVRKLWSLVSGAMIADFEIQAYNNQDMTADELIKLYKDIEKRYTGSNGNLNFQSVSHIFEMPGYYISYSVSSAASFELWNTSVYDYDKAVSDYMNVIGTASSFGISETLSKSGMNDIFDDDTIKNIAYTLRKKYTDIEISDEAYDINGDGSITSEDALLILMYSVGNAELSEKQLEMADIDKDNSISSYDALLILNKIVGL